MKIKVQRPSDEIPTSSMADIAFLLLIFWLVTTTIDSDEGTKRQLPPPVPPPVLHLPPQATELRRPPMTTAQGTDPTITASAVDAVGRRHRTRPSASRDGLQWLGRPLPFPSPSHG